MAATATVPASNIAGNNQTSPTAVVKGAKGSIPTSPITMPGTTGTSPTQNNFVPVTPSSVLSTAGGATVANPLTLINSSENVYGTTGALDKQLSDIYGKGIGGELGSLLQSIGGVDSATLQEYIKSLAPQEAAGEANINAELGASGVSPNSSVNAIAQSNLQAQEFAAIAGESANLTQSGQQLQASILSGMQQPAEQQVAQSGWDVFGQVMQGAAGLAGDVVGAAGKAGGFGSLF